MKLKNEKLAAKINYLLEIVIAFSIGASVAFAFVVIHQMLTTEWTW
jgi:hypothetical protein|tara:strand:+ start:324 stop:461 length:138 start_codon:yes stop_codon:yes gene_type:complete